MATPVEKVEASAPPAPAVEPPPEKAVAAAVDEISKEVKEGKKGEEGEGDLKAALLISGAVVAVIGAIFAIFKKVKKAD